MNTTKKPWSLGGATVALLVAGACADVQSPTAPDMPASFSAAATSSSAGGLFWTEGPGGPFFTSNTDKVRRANLDGSGVTDVVTGFRFTSGIQVASDGKVYFNDSNQFFTTGGRTYRVNPDGTSLELLIDGPTRRPEGLAVDVGAGHLYVARFAQSVERYDFSGTLQANVGGICVEDVALDLGNGHLYFTDLCRGGIGSVSRMNLDGSGLVDLVVGLQRARGIALDLVNGKIYFTDDPTPFFSNFDGRLMRANLDGSAFEVLRTGLDFPWGVALDGAGRVYWAEINGNKIGRANVDGSGAMDLITGLDGPMDLSIPPVTIVEIDIKPGSNPNSINCRERDAAIAVAILTTASFDATTVDHTTVTFEGARETHVDRKTGLARRHQEDADGDGDIDLVLHFRLGDTSLTCSSTQGTLKGGTFGGQAIEGTDAVRMINAPM